jgi:hypothetical protein
MPLTFSVCPPNRIQLLPGSTGADPDFELTFGGDRRIHGTTTRPVVTRDES